MKRILVTVNTKGVEVMVAVGVIVAVALGDPVVVIETVISALKDLP